ncbi:MAG: tyrosine-type recombinase/integrase [Bifidobacteriaceae bacterium]|jgi:integrase|nr:tyrosine-type recombinase/integrase [Bifidobacteriaceae bacterium]
MSAIADQVAEYLRLRRAMGHKLATPGRYLAHFAEFMDNQHAGTVTTALAVAWAAAPDDGQGKPAPSRPARRLEAVRGFARYLTAVDPGTEVPPTGVFPSGCHRPAPFIFTPSQIADLVAAAGRLPRFDRSVIYPVLFGLLAVTGMRVGEALALTIGDTDLEQGMLTIRRGKSPNPRLVPLHPTATQALNGYSEWLSPTANPAAPLFRGPDRSRPMEYWNALYAFHQACAIAGLDQLKPKPLIHQLRHSFAVNTLLDWCRQGTNIAAAMPTLSTYLGHTQPADTYWYFTAVPELLAYAAGRLALTEKRRMP